MLANLEIGAVVFAVLAILFALLVKRVLEQFEKADLCYIRQY